MKTEAGDVSGKRFGETGRGAGSRELLKLLDALAAARRAYLARGAISVVLAVGLALLSIAVALHRIVPGWHLLPLVTFVLFWGGLAAAVLFGTLRRLLPVRSRLWLARTVGARMDRGSLFSAALEFSTARRLSGARELSGTRRLSGAREFSKSGDRLGAYSPYLMAETVRRAMAALRRARPVAMFAESGRPAWIAAALLVGCLLAVQVAFQGEEMGRVLAAVSDPLIYFHRPYGVNLHVVSRDREVSRVRR